MKLRKCACCTGNTFGQTIPVWSGLLVVTQIRSLMVVISSVFLFVHPLNQSLVFILTIFITDCPYLPFRDHQLGNSTECTLLPQIHQNILYAGDPIIPSCVLSKTDKVACRCQVSVYLSRRQKQGSKTIRDPPVHDNYCYLGVATSCIMLTGVHEQINV